MNVVALKKLIQSFDIISFDIFDTLLLRPYVNPADMFVHMERAYKKTGFVAWRTGAEAAFYRTHGTTREARLVDIYSVPGDFADMQAAEMDWEYNILTANPKMKEIYDFAIAAGKRVIIASDMYLPQEFIERTLSKNGFAGYHKLYLSNEINHRKDRGDMYGYILADLDVAPNKVLHIGDNKHSDFEQARRNGISAYLYTRVADSYMAKNRKAASFYAANPGLGASIITAMCAARSSFGDYWTDFGYRYAGPVAYAYARWIYNRATECGLKNILFIARDGYLVQKVFNTINQGEIKNSYVYAPRVLNYTANLDYDPNLPEQPRIICEYFEQNTGELTPAAYIDANRASFEEMAAAEKQRTGYCDYIRSATAGADRVGVVDTISGQMSGQRLIEKESGVRTHGFYWLTLPGRKCLSDFEHSDFLENHMRDAFLSGNKCDLMELIFSAPENPIITMRDGMPVHQQVQNPAEAARHEICRRIEAGALAFAGDVAKFFAGRDLFIEPAQIFNLITTYVSMPESDDIRAMFAVKKSPYADNSLYVPLFSGRVAPWQIGRVRRLIWHTPAQRAALVLARPLRVKMRGLRQIKIIFLPEMAMRVFGISLFDKYGIGIGGYKNGGY